MSAQVTLHLPTVSSSSHSCIPHPYLYCLFMALLPVSFSHLFAKLLAQLPFFWQQVPNIHHLLLREVLSFITFKLIYR